MSKPLAACIARETRGDLAHRYAYVLITPARNEAAFIEMTIRSVVAQTVKPLKWVIVSDGSTDSTDDIVKKYCAEHSWIELLRMPERRERHFAAKVRAFQAGRMEVKDLDFEIIGNLDADVSFETDYFSFLLAKFAENLRLGVAGTAFREGTDQYDYRFTSIEHVSGQCQMFRRKCFDEIGGYVPAEGGGIDLVAVIKARMKGWETRTFTEKVFLHHRKMGTAKYGSIAAKFKDGEKDYVLGGHPLWEIFRWIYQMSKPPVVVGGCALMSGYICALMRRQRRSVTDEVMVFRRREQMSRLRSLLMGNRHLSNEVSRDC
jgi:poly-beta-1,6-N-acetyl-D-glucosamine synthase